MSQNDNLLHGSYRSYAGFNLKDFFGQIDVVNWAKGHNEAGGVELSVNSLDQFKYNINNMFNSGIDNNVIEYDIDLESSEIDTGLINKVLSFSYISGKEIEPPSFLIKDVMVMDRKVLGKTKNTVKLDCGEFEAIKFNVNEEYASELGTFDVIDIIGKLSINKFYNFGLKRLVITPQIIVDDYIKK